MVVLTVILMNPVASLFKMWATRKLAVDDSGPVAVITAGAVNLVS
jgi:hypothetical protein